ncbi:DUF4870 domain-containing protein [Polaribacter sp. R77954]|uniref:DUF4870 domain-containing protein n=1 Tax=Polaribacter sp. R77954 TaxID=3093870 RepID=UPI0037C68223
MENTSVKDGKTIAIISHLWVVGLVIAFIMNMNKKNYFASFYIRQMIGLNILQFLNGAIIHRYFGQKIGWVLGIVLFVLWIISLIGAIQGEEKEVPVVGEHFQNWFRGI